MFTAQNLRQFYGSEKYYRLGKLVCTDGINYLMDNGCHWLVSDIATFQMLDKVSREDFQAWSLIITPEDKSAILTCTDGNDKVLHKVKIPYTDFPLPEITIFVERGSIDGQNEVMVCMLPSER